MNLPAKHPLWSLLRLTIIMISLTVVLYLCADRFDGTEINSLVWMFIAISGTEGISQLLERLKNRKE